MAKTIVADNLAVDERSQDIISNNTGLLPSWHIPVPVEKGSRYNYRKVPFKATVLPCDRECLTGHVVINNKAV